MIDYLKRAIFPQEEENLLEEFQKEYFEHKEFVRKTVFYIVGTTFVDDIVQETFTKAWKAYGSFKKEAKVKSWLYRIAINTSYDFIKKNKNMILEEFIEVDVAGTEYEDIDLINNGMKLLNTKQAEVFMLYYKFGFTLQEISNELCISEGTVKSRFFKAKDIFTNYIKLIEGDKNE